MDGKYQAFTQYVPLPPYRRKGQELWCQYAC